MATKQIGTKIRELLKERNVNVKSLLQQIRTKYPSERGLTENGFKYSLARDTVKSGIIMKLAEALDVPLIDFLPDEYVLSASQLRDRAMEIELLTKRVSELEKDKEQYLKIISFLEGRIKSFEEGPEKKK